MRTPQVTGLSMRPRIDEGEVVLINTLAFRLGAPHRGDIIAFRHERSSPRVYLKRIIGLPGERVRIDRGAVVVDGKAVEERYVVYRDRRSTAEVVVPPNAFFVLGDNRANSDDSRAWGFVDGGDVVGKATLAIWPLDHVGRL